MTVVIKTSIEYTELYILKTKHAIGTTHINIQLNTDISMVIIIFEHFNKFEYKLFVIYYHKQIINEMTETNIQILDIFC